MPVLSPLLTIAGAADAVTFYREVFGAQEVRRNVYSDGRLLFVELRIGDSKLRLCDDFPEWHGGEAHNPIAFGGSPVALHLEVKDVDTVVARAVAHGAIVTMPVEDMFWGDRYGQVRDPFGHEWAVYTHLQDLTPEEIAKAQAAFFAKRGK